MLMPHILVLAAVSTGSSRPPSKPLHASIAKLEAVWAIDLDVQGKAVRIRSPDGLPSPLGPSVEKQIEAWQFEPGKIDGKAAPTHTYLRLLLQIENDEEGDTQVRIVRAHTGPAVTKEVHPAFPSNAVHKHGSRLVVVRAGYDAAGAVTDVTAVDADDVGDPPLVATALEASRRWSFEPERVGDRGVAGHVYIPYCFRIGPASSRPAPCKPWKQPNSGQETRATQPVAEDPAAKLLTPLDEENR
jgi:TonB family protein